MTFNNGEKAVVVGAAGGVGSAVARRLRDEGCSVVSLDRETMDISRPESIRKVLPEILRETEVDIFVNCVAADMEADRKMKFGAVSKDVYDEVIDVTLKGTMICTALVADDMARRGRQGRIINTTPFNSYSYSPYGISKAGIMEYTRQMAEKYQGTVIVEALAPCACAPEQIAAAVGFLASPVGKYLNGQTVVTGSGGMAKRRASRQRSNAGEALDRSNILLVTNAVLPENMVAELETAEGVSLRVVEVFNSLTFEMMKYEAERMQGPVSHIVNLCDIATCNAGVDAIYYVYQWLQTVASYVGAVKDKPTICTAIIGDGRPESKVVEKSLETCVRGLGDALGDSSVASSGIVAQPGVPPAAVIDAALFLSGKSGQGMSDQVLKMSLNSD